MNILYIVQHFSGPGSTGGSRPYENATRLVQLGHNVTLLCGSSEKMNPQDVEAARDLGVSVHQAPIKYAQGFSYFQRLLAFKRYMQWAVREGCSIQRPDVVFASSTPLTIGDIGREVALYHHVPLVFEVRDLWPEVPVSLGALKNPLLRWSAFRMAKRVYKASAHVVTLSTDMKRGIMAWGVPEEDITVIPNCSDTHLFGGTDNRGEWRAKYGFEGKTVCIHPGAMGRVNGLDYLLDVGKELDAESRNDILLALVGSGTEKARLTARIETEGIKSVRIYDPVVKRDMPALLSAADIGAVTVAPLPHLEMNSANKFFDFLAAGLPVVINYGGWQAQVLQESGAGMAADPVNPSTMARMLIRLSDSPDERQRMGMAARRLAETEYDRGLLVSRLESVLIDVTGVRSAEPVEARR